MMQRYITAAMLACSVFAGPRDVTAQIVATPDATVRLSIDIEQPRGPFALRLHFERNNVDDDALLVTSLNLVNGDTPRNMQVGNLTDYTSHLTGWFVIKQSQELWVGIALKKGQSVGNMEVRVPGLLEETSEYPTKYELVYAKPDGTLSKLANGAIGVTYASLTEILIEQPTWGTIDDKPSSGWIKQRGNAFLLAPESLKSSSAHLVVTRDPKFLADLMSKSLAPFSGGLAAATIFFVVLLQMSERVGRSHRILCGTILGVCLLLLNYLGGIWPINIKQLFFDGAGVFGFALPTLAFLVLPERYLARLGHFVDRLRGTNAPAEPVVATPGETK